LQDFSGYQRPGAIRVRIREAIFTVFAQTSTFELPLNESSPGQQLAGAEPNP